MSGGITIAGTGIAVVAHATVQTRAAIETAGKVFFLAPDPVAARWVESLNPSAESLNPFLERGQPRGPAYEAMADRILDAAQQGAEVCAVFYGHPAVLVQPVRLIRTRAAAAGIAVSIVPAISAQDCLYADLGIDPGDGGFQSFEATEFLVSDRDPDVTCQLLLWQIGVIGQPLYLDGSPGSDAPCSMKALQMLQARLADAYGSGHEVVLYEAALYVVCTPRITRLPLGALSDTPPAVHASLFVPRLHSAPKRRHI